MAEKTVIDGVELILSTPDVIDRMRWIGEDTYMIQLLAAWTVVDSKRDIPMNPQILGKPGVGKTTLAYSAAQNLKLPIYIFQCTVDTRPEDLLISPVIGENNSIKYHASPLVTAMIKGGVCILDEANRMAEKSWASLAPLLDQRRYIESIIAGIKIKAHPNFRICTTMNEDSSTFEIPEYIHSRLQPQIFIDFPERNEEMAILEFNLPYARKDIIIYTVNFLQHAHAQNKNYTIRDGINICRYYLKLENYNNELNKNRNSMDALNKKLKTESKKIDLHLFHQAIGHVLGLEGQEFLAQAEKTVDLKKINQKFQDMFDHLNSAFFEDKLDNDDFDEGVMEEEMDDMSFFDEMEDRELYYIRHEEEDDFPSEKEDDVLRIIEEKDEDDYPPNKNSREQSDKFFDNPNKDIQSPEDPNDIIRKFLERREKARKKKMNKDKSDTEEEKDSQS